MSNVQTRVSYFLEGVRRNMREIVTPEGAALPVEVGQAGERIGAFLLDMLIWLGTTIVLYMMILAFLPGSSTIGIFATLILFISFIVRNLYFIYFELIWQGATPGKRVSKLRVIDRRGGPLLPRAIIARNLSREVEVFLPLGLLLSASVSASGWVNLTLGVWLLLFTALPLFNKDRMRGGDFIAGTMVIVLPKRLLLPDMVEAQARYQFTPKQLSAYGAFELQILEELLRRPPTAETTQVLAGVCEKICRRIEWPDPVKPSETTAFLKEFYAAERAFLEREKLFGKNREDKNSPPSQGK